MKRLGAPAASGVVEDSSFCIDIAVLPLTSIGHNHCPRMPDSRFRAAAPVAALYYGCRFRCHYHRCRCTVVQNRRKNTKNSHVIIYEQAGKRMSERSEALEQSEQYRAIDFFFPSLVYDVIPPMSFFHQMGHDLINIVTV